jgi:pyruvate dehydrogenase E1 component alpha subunit
VLEAALDKARHGGGPHVIEALTYRLGDHTTADDARRYRPEAELELRQRGDPLARFKKFLLRERLWSEAEDTAALEDGAAQVERAVAEFLAVQTRPPQSMFEHLFAELPRSLREQADSLLGDVHHE